MDVVISSRNMKVTDDLREYVLKKAARLERYMANLNDLRVELTEVNASRVQDRHVAQLTARSQRGTILRAEERSADIQTSIDAAVDKLSRQIERYKGRGKWRRRGKGQMARQEQQVFESALALEPEGEIAQEAELDVVRRKNFAVTPMSEDEAIEQLEMLDHDFFLYYNTDTASINVAYRRQDGGYGILIPVLS